MHVQSGGGIDGDYKIGHGKKETMFFWSKAICNATERGKRIFEIAASLAFRDTLNSSCPFPLSILIIYCMGDTGGPGPEIFVLQSDEGARENTVREDRESNFRMVKLIH